MSEATWHPAAVDLEAHADALFPGHRPDADVPSQSLLGEEGADLVRRVLVPLEGLEGEETQFYFIIILSDWTLTLTLTCWC